MRILCVGPSYWPAFQYGGSISALHGMNKALIEKGVDVTVYTTNVGLDGKVAVNQQVYVNGVKVYYFEFMKLFEFMGTTGWQFSLRMTKALRENLKSFDVIYIAVVWNYSSAAAAYYCRLYRKPYIVAPMGMLYPYSLGKKAWKKWPYYRLITRRDIKAATAIHYSTQHEKEQCHSRLGLKNSAIIIPHGIELSEFAYLSRTTEFKKSYPFLKDKKVILFLSRISWKKGLDLLVKAYGILARKRRDVHLLIVGPDEGGYAKKVRTWLRDEGILERVTFTGMLLGKEKLAAYAGSDLFVLPSYSENFGMVVVEAMACGLPVVISDQVGLCKEVRGAKAGFVISTDAAQLASTLTKLLDDPRLSKKMGANGRRLVTEKYSWDIIADKTITLYNKLLDRN